MEDVIMHMIHKKYLNNHENYYELLKVYMDVMDFKQNKRDNIKYYEKKGVMTKSKMPERLMIANLFNELVNAHKEIDRLKAELEKSLIL